MAQETILSISLKEYKQQIDDVKASMLGLEKESEQYKKLAQQATDMQNKLNQVMFDAKNAGDAEKNSLAGLKEQLRQLKSEANNLDIGSKAFEETAKQIMEVNNKLKEAEGSMGIFNRNVGDYGNQILKSFEQMGVSIKGLSPAFAVVSTAGKGFKGVLDVLKAHPILTVLTVLVGVFIKLKDAIGKNEELSKKWSVAMSAFKPVLNAITNGIDWLAGKLVDVVSFVTSNLPKMLTKIGSFSKTVLGFVGKIVDVVWFIPKTVAKVGKQVSDLVLSGINTLAKGAAKLLDAVGLDSWAEKLTSAANSVESIGKSITGAIVDGVNNAANYVAKLGDSIDGMMKKWSTATSNQIELTKKQNKLDEDRRKQEVETEASLLRQQELRNKIAEASGEEKKKLLKQLKDEIETNGKKELDLAKQTLALEERKRALAPNSREDNLYFEQLQKNVIQVEAAYKAATVRINKQITSTTETLSKQQEKAMNDAEKKAHQTSVEILKNVRLSIETSNSLAAETIARLNADYEKIREFGQITYKQENEYETKRNETVLFNLNTQKKAVEEALKDEKLLENERLALQIQNYKISTQLVEENTRHRINSDKIWLKERDRVFKEDLFHQKEYSKATLLGITLEQNKELVELAKKYTNGEIEYSKYQKRLSKIQNRFEDERLVQELDNLKNIVVVYENHIEEIRKRFKEGAENTEEFKKVWQEYLDVIQEVEEAESNLSVHRANQQVKDKETTKKNVENQINTYMKLANSIGSVMGTVADIMENNIKQKVKNGEISKKEAEKEFERVKKLQISEAVLSTISGAVGAFMGTWKDETIQPIWLRGIIAGLNTASVLGAGFAQIQQIKQTQFGSEGSGSSAVAASNTGISVMPLLDENQDVNQLSQLQTAQNTGSSSDNRVYILQSDIEDSNNQVKVRENNTTF